MLSPYRLVIGLMKLPPSDANCKVIFPKNPISLSNISSFRCHCQGAADAVCVSSIVTAIAVHNTFPPGDLLLTLRVNSPCFFIIFHLLIFVFTFRQHKHTTEDGISLRSFFKSKFFDFYYNYIIITVLVFPFQSTL